MKSPRRNVSEDPPQTISRRSSRPDGEESSSMIPIELTIEFSSMIPIELTIEIFSKLPLKSIARCRSVSKPWASILRRQDFTDLFFTKSSARPKLLFASHKGSEFRFFSSPQARENASLITADHHVSFPVERVHHISGGPINGIFCVSYDRILKGSETVTTECVSVICNPSTRQSFTLPKMKTMTKETKLISFLGYDPIEKQHKVLAMTDQNDRGVEHQVLTLGTGNLTWRMAECGVPNSFPWGECLCINGVLYYAARVSDGDYVIVCFDVRSEKYSFVKPAESRMFTGKLINFEGKLASVNLRSPFLNDKTTSLEMWILEDPGKHEWSKRFFSLPPMGKESDAKEFIQFAGVTVTYEFVFSSSFMSVRFHVYYYNFVKEAVTRVEIQGMGAFVRDFPILIGLNHVEDVKLMELF